MRKAKGQLGRRLTHFSNHCLETEDRTPKGRELWYIITKYFSTGHTAEAMFSLADLQNVTLANPKEATIAQLESFLISWNAVCDALFVIPDYDTRLHLFYEQVKHCRLLAEDISHFDRAKARREQDGCLGYLMDSVERIIERHRRETTRQGFSSGLKQEVQDRRYTGLAGVPERETKPDIDRSKTFCKFFKGGHCKKGSECDYSHNPKHEVKAEPNKSEKGKGKSAPNAKRTARPKKEPGAPATAPAEDDKAGGDDAEAGEKMIRRANSIWKGDANSGNNANYCIPT
jgi:hypothetical protein